MECTGCWGSQVEINAAANLLKAKIYTSFVSNPTSLDLPPTKPTLYSGAMLRGSEEDSSIFTILLNVILIEWPLLTYYLSPSAPELQSPDSRVPSTIVID